MVASASVHDDVMLLHGGKVASTIVSARPCLSAASAVVTRHHQLLLLLLLQPQHDTRAALLPLAHNNATSHVRALYCATGRYAFYIKSLSSLITTLTDAGTPDEA